MRCAPVFAMLVFAIALVSGCQSIGSAAAPTLATVPFPAGCAAFELSQRRCAAVVAEASEQEGLRQEDIATIELTSEPPCDPDPHVLCDYTTAFVANVRFHLQSGEVVDRQIRCGVGGQYSQVCTETPQIELGGPTTNGYRDLPCGASGNDCATPLPSLEPAAQDAARPLRVRSLDIPIDHVGPYRIEAGRAILPNGVLTESAFALADSAPTDVMLDEGTAMSLIITGTDADSRPFDNYYAHGWHPGTEEVVATLEFSVARFDPGAVLTVRDLVVR